MRENHYIVHYESIMNVTNHISNPFKTIDLTYAECVCDMFEPYKHIYIYYPK